jgi:hypothetical protein
VIPAELESLQVKLGKTYSASYVHQAIDTARYMVRMGIMILLALMA